MDRKSKATIHSVFIHSNLIKVKPGKSLFRPRGSINIIVNTVELAK